MIVLCFYTGHLTCPIIAFSWSQEELDKLVELVKKYEDTEAEEDGYKKVPKHHLLERED